MAYGLVSLIIAIALVLMYAMGFYDGRKSK